MSWTVLGNLRASELDNLPSSYSISPEGIDQCIDGLFTLDDLGLVFC